jgi:hypothetical protein
MLLPPASDIEAPRSPQRLFVAAAAIALAVAFLLVQLSSHNQLGPFSNWFVPDGITLANTFRDYWSGRLLSYEISWGVPIHFVYAPAHWLGVLSFGAVNVGLLVLTRRICNVPILPGLLLLPYFLLAIALPSKDILVLCATYAVVCGALRGHYLTALALSVMTFFVRDGAAVVFVGFIVMWAIYRRLPRTLHAMLLAMFIGAVLLDRVLQELFGDLFIYVRNRSVFENVADQTRLDVMQKWGLPLRVFANITNLAMRPSLFDTSDGIALVGVAYFVCGLGILYAGCVSFLYVRERREDIQVAAGMMFFATLAVVSLNPLIQPRYLLPAAAMVISLQTTGRESGSGLRPVLLGVCALLTVAGMGAYALLNVAAPPPTEISIWSPF